MRHFFDGLTSWQGFSLSCVLILVCIAGIVLAGCKTTPTQTQTIAASIAVKYATAKYIEKAGEPALQKARAARVVAVVDQIEGLASGDVQVTVDALVAYVAQRLPVDLSPADRVLAGALIDAAAAELKARIGEGTLPKDGLLQVRSVLQWVREGAAPYAAS